jgi:hypothetical protein
MKVGYGENRKPAMQRKRVYKVEIARPRPDIGAGA